MKSVGVFYRIIIILTIDVNLTVDKECFMQEHGRNSFTQTDVGLTKRCAVCLIYVQQSFIQF